MLISFFLFLFCLLPHLLVCIYPFLFWPFFCFILVVFLNWIFQTINVFLRYCCFFFSGLLFNMWKSCYSKRAFFLIFVMCILIAFFWAFLVLLLLRFSFVYSASVGASQLVLIIHLGLSQVTQPPQMGYICSLFMRIVPFTGSSSGMVVWLLVNGEWMDHDKLCFSCPVLNAFSN